MSLKRVKELLHKHRLVEGMVRNQPMPHHDLVEGLVHKQHLAELQTLLTRLTDNEIVNLLEELPLDEAKQLWLLMPETRMNDLLWELSDPLRTELAEQKAPEAVESRMNAFILVEGRLRQVPITSKSVLEGIQPVWIDLLNTSNAERHYLGRSFGLELPEPGEAIDLEVSSRFQVADDGTLHLHSNFLLDREGESRSVPVSFIVHDQILFTLRNEELPVFRLQRLRARNQPGYVSDCFDILIDLYGADVEYSADALQDIYGSLGQVGRQVLSENMPDTEAARILADIAEKEDLNGRIRSNILDTQRALSFLMRGKVFSASQIEDVRQILRDIESLNSHTSFLFDKINFLMDATVGFININQNQRVSQLTKISIVFVPINIIAGIGGMSEYSMMTKGIPWPVSYGAFVVAMGLVGWLTYSVLRYFETRRLQQNQKPAQ